MGHVMSGNFGSLGADVPSTSPIKSFSEKVSTLLTVQSAVDKKIASLPAGADKTRLMKERESSRGIFSTYVLPVYKKVRAVMQEYAPAFAGEEEDQTMGVIPLIAWGIIAAAGAASTAAAGYVYTAHAREMKILNDPAFSAAQKTEMIRGGGIGAAVGDAKKIVFGLIALVVVWQGFKMWKNR